MDLFFAVRHRFLVVSWVVSVLEHPDSPFRRTVSGLWKSLMKVNDHLPRVKKTLKQLLTEDDPKCIAKDGTTIWFEKKDLEFLGEFIPKKFHDRIRLPIVLVSRTDLGRGIYAIIGNDLEKFIINKILDRTNADFNFWEDAELNEFLNRAEVFDLRHKMRSTTILGFSAEAPTTSPEAGEFTFRRTL